MIDWKEGAVCYARNKQWHFDDVGHEFKLRSFVGKHCCDNDYALGFNDFQLNEPHEGYYIPKSELDTEEKYNQAVEVFGLSGFGFSDNATSGYFEFKNNTGSISKQFPLNYLSVCKDGLWHTDESHAKVKLNFDQLMVIGELKRKMNERENEFIESRQLDVEMIKKSTGSGGCGGDSAFGFLNTSELPNSLKPKAKEAYRMLESMGIEWNNVEGKWFKKEWL